MKKKIILLLCLLTCIFFVSCSEKEQEFKKHEASGLEYRMVEDGRYEVKNPLYNVEINSNDVYAYSDITLKLASLILDKPLEELTMFKGMSTQVIRENLSLFDNAFKNDIIVCEDFYNITHVDKDKFKFYYKWASNKLDMCVAENIIGGRIDYANYKYKISDIGKYFANERVEISKNYKSYSQDDLEKLYKKIDSKISKIYKYTDPYDQSRTNYSEGYKKWKSDKSYQPTKKEFSEMSDYEKDQIAAYEIEKYWTKYPEKGLSSQEVKEMIIKERPWLFK